MPTQHGDQQVNEVCLFLFLNGGDHFELVTIELASSHTGMTNSKWFSKQLLYDKSIRCGLVHPNTEWYSGGNVRVDCVYVITNTVRAMHQNYVIYSPYHFHHLLLFEITKLLLKCSREFFEDLLNTM